MDRLVAFAFWLLVVVLVLGTLPWVLARLPAGWLVAALVAVGAGLVGRHLRRHGSHG